MVPGLFCSRTVVFLWQHFPIRSLLFLSHETFLIDWFVLLFFLAQHANFHNRHKPVVDCFNWKSKLDKFTNTHMNLADILSYSFTHSSSLLPSLIHDATFSLWQPSLFPFPNKYNCERETNGGRGRVGGGGGCLALSGSGFMFLVSLLDWRSHGFGQSTNWSTCYATT